MDHSFDTEEAKMFGVPEAIIIRHLRYWIAKNAANDRHRYAPPAHYKLEGERHWTYNSTTAFAAIFEYWNAKQIGRILDSLLSSKVIIKANFNQKAYDRTLWYAFSHAEAHRKTIPDLMSKNRENHLPKTANANSENGKPIPDVITDIKTDISFSKEKGETTDFEVKKPNQKGQPAARPKSEFRSSEVATQYDEVMSSVHAAEGIGYERVDWSAHQSTMQSLKKIDESCRKWAREKYPEAPRETEAREFIFVSAFSYFYEIAKSTKTTLTITPQKIHRNLIAIKNHGVQRHNRNSPGANVTAQTVANAAVAVADGW
jgi:hypothetical protein